MKKWYDIKAEAGEITIFDEIGFFGVSADAFKKDFDKIPVGQRVKILMNSPGGSVFDGMAIYNILKSQSERIDVEVVGLAASMASVIALSGSTMKMREGTFLMIHNPKVFAYGDAKDLRKGSELLEQVKGQLLDIYESHFNISREEISDLMDEETWMTPTQAKQYGVSNETIKAQKMAAVYDQKKLDYGNTPKSLLPTEVIPVVVIEDAKVEPTPDCGVRDRIERVIKLNKNKIQNGD